MATDIADLKATIERAQLENSEMLRGLSRQLAALGTQLAEAAAQEELARLRLAAAEENLVGLRRQLEVPGSEAQPPKAKKAPKQVRGVGKEAKRNLNTRDGKASAPRPKELIEITEAPPVATEASTAFVSSLTIQEVAKLVKNHCLFSRFRPNKDGTWRMDHLGMGGDKGSRGKISNGFSAEEAIAQGLWLVAGALHHRATFEILNVEDARLFDEIKHLVTRVSPLLGRKRHR